LGLKRILDLIAQVKPGADQDAAKYLRKAAKVMISRKKQAEWHRYLQNLKEENFRKKRLIEILESLEGKPIIKTRH